MIDNGNNILTIYENDDRYRKVIHIIVFRIRNFNQSFDININHLLIMTAYRQ